MPSAIRVYRLPPRDSSSRCSGQFTTRAAADPPRADHHVGVAAARPAAAAAPPGRASRRRPSRPPRRSRARRAQANPARYAAPRPCLPGRCSTWTCGVGGGQLVGDRAGAVGLLSSATSTSTAGTAARTRPTIDPDVVGLVVGRDDHQHPTHPRVPPVRPSTASPTASSAPCRLTGRHLPATAQRATAPARRRHGQRRPTPPRANARPGGQRTRRPEAHLPHHHRRGVEPVAPYTRPSGVDEPGDADRGGHQRRPGRAPPPAAGPSPTAAAPRPR